MLHKKTPRTHLSAFSLIELMVVVAIVAILASFGLPAYQDYTRKAHVAEIIQLVRPIEYAVMENAVQGRPFAEGIQLPTHPWIQSIAIDVNGGTISVVFNPAKFKGWAYTIGFVPKDTGNTGGSHTLYGVTGSATDSKIPDGVILWSCRSTGTTDWPPGNMPAKYVPESCKGAAYF